jgi:hypothetical protein
MFLTVLPGVYLRRNISAPSDKELRLIVDKTCAASIFEWTAGNVKKLDRHIRNERELKMCSLTVQ